MKTVRLYEKEAAAIFEAATTQAEYCVWLYEHVLRRAGVDPETVSRFNGRAFRVSKTTWCMLADQAMRADERLFAHRDPMDRPMKGGAWMNYGFSSDDTVGDGYVRIDVDALERTEA